MTVTESEAGVRVSDGFARPDGARFLAEHYPDRPLSLLPRSVVTRLCQAWSRRPDVFFLLAEAEGRPAGFVFVQAIGEKPWRSLLRDWRALPFLPFVLAAQRAQQLLRWPAPPAAPGTAPEEASLPPLENIAAWLDQGWREHKAANVEFIYVSPDMRGRQVGGALLDALVARLQEAGLTRCYAFIAHGNAASVRLFAKAGFGVYRGPLQLRAVREF